MITDIQEHKGSTPNLHTLQDYQPYLKRLETP